MIERGLRVSIDSRPAKAGADEYVSSVRSMREAAQGAQVGLKNLDAAAGGGGATLASLASSARLAAAGLAVAGAAVAGIRRVVDIASDFQQLRVQMDALYATAGKGEAAFQALRRFTTDTPQQLDKMTGAWISLRSNGLDPSLHAMQLLGNVATGAHKDVSDLVDAAAAAANGDAGRLKAFGVNVKADGERLKLTMGDVSETVDANVGNIIGFLEKLGQTKFAGAMEREAGTYKGALDGISKSVNEIADEVGRGLLGELTTEALAFKQWVQDHQYSANELGVFVSDLVVSFKALFEVIAAVSKPLTDLLSVTDKLPGWRELRASVADFFAMVLNAAADAADALDDLHVFDLTPGADGAEAARQMREYAAALTETGAGLRSQAAAAREATTGQLDLNGALDHGADNTDHLTKKQQQQAAEALKTAKALRDLVGDLDPAADAQQKFADGMAIADKFLATFPDRTLEYARAVGLLVDELERATQIPGKLPIKKDEGYTGAVLGLKASDLDTIQQKAVEVGETIKKSERDAGKVSEEEWTRRRAQMVEFYDDQQQLALSAGRNLVDALSAGLNQDWGRMLQSLLGAWVDMLNKMQAASEAADLAQSMGKSAQGGTSGRGGNMNYGETANQLSMVAGWVGIAYSAYQALKAWNDDKRIREMKGHIYLNLDNARELTVGLVDAWKNGLSRFANDLETAINDMVDKLGMNSQLDAIVPVDIVQQDAGFVVKFQGAAEQWFKTAEEAFNAALLGTLERATISGISPEQQAVLDHAARNVRSSTPQSVTADLGLATWVRDLGQSDFGTRFRTEMETFQDAIHRASEIGFPTASIQRIVDAYNQFLADSKASLDATVASLSGTGNDWTAMVDERMQRIRDVIAAERDYNRTLDEQALANARRVEEIRTQIARLEAMTNHGPVTIKDFKPVGPGDTPGPSGPGDTGGGTGGGGTGGGRGPLGGGGEYDTDRIREQIEALYRELDALGGVALDTAADINASTLSMIQGTRDLFTSGLKEYLDIGKSQFQLANEKAEATFRGLSGPDGAIQHLYDENMKLAEGMTDARAQTAAVNAAEAIRTQQLAELAEAERKWAEEQKRLAQETAASIFDQIAAMLPEGSEGRQQAIDNSEKLRWTLAKAKLQMEYEGLKVAEQEYELKHDGARLISQQTLDTIGGLINLIPDLPPPGQHGGGAGGGNRQAKADFLDELARLGRPESTGPLGDALQGINDQFDGLRKRAQDLHFGQDVIDQINKLEEAAKKALGAKTSADLIADIRDRGPVGDARAALIKKQQDMMAHAAELGMDPKLIQRWFHHMMNVLVAEVQGAIASFGDLSGLGDQFHAITEKAADLRKSVKELGNGMSDAERAAALAAIDIAETARLQALAGQTVLGIFQQMADMLPEGAAKEEVIKRAKEAQYQLALAELRLKIEGLKVAELEYEATHNGQRLIAQETFDFFERTFNAIRDAHNNPGVTPPDPGAVKAWQDAMDDFRGTGLAGEFRAIGREANDLRDKLKSLTLTEAERARMAAEIDAAEQQRMRQLADQSLLGLFQSIADMLPDGTTEKAQAVAMAKQLEYQMAMAELQIKYQGLIVANEEYKIKHDGIGLLKQETLDWIGDAINLINTMHGPQPAGDGGGGLDGPDTTPPVNGNGQGWWAQHAAEQEALAQAAADHAQQLADLYDTLRGYQDLRLSAPERELRDLLSTFDDLRQRCIDLGGDMSQVDDAMGAALGDFWDRLLGPLREFEQSLNLDTSLSTLTPAQRMQEAQRQFDAAAARAQAGDLSAYAQLPELARQLLTEGRGFYASGSEYNALVAQIEALFASLQAGHPTLLPGAGSTGRDPSGLLGIGPHGPLNPGGTDIRGPLEILDAQGSSSAARVDSGLAGIAPPIVRAVKEASDAQIATRHEEMRVVQGQLVEMTRAIHDVRDDARQLRVAGRRG